MIFDVFDEIAEYRSVTKHDGMMLLYNFAVVLSGGYAVLTFGIPDRVTLFAFALVFSIFWTVYFKFAMFRRFTDHPRFTGNGDADASAALD